MTRAPRLWPTTPNRSDAEVLHHLDLIQCHGALRIVDVVRSAVGLGAFAVAAEIGGNDGVFPGEFGGDPVPDGVRLRRTVQQEQWRAATADDHIDHRA